MSKWFTCFILTLSLSSCYTIQLAYQGNNLINSRVRVESALADEKLDEETKEKFLLVEKVLSFAFNAGLNTDGAYRYYIHSETNVVSYLVQAAYTDRLEFKTWWFPIIGSVPYKGYFSELERDEKEKQLIAEGFDTFTTGAAAFSSLGWFEDPIYTSMLMRDEANLAQLFFHELTHRTYWSPGDVDFNENLAEYVGDYLTEQYLIQENNKELLNKFHLGKKDQILYKTWLKELKESLNSLYDNKEHLDIKVIMKKKEEIFQTYLQDKKPDFKVYNFLHMKKPWNNARVLAASLYIPEKERFEKAHQCLRDKSIENFLKKLEEAQNLFDDQFEALDSLCKK